MATETTSIVYLLTEDEKNERNAMMFLKGSIVGFLKEKGVKYSSKKSPTREFQKGLDNAKPKICTNERFGSTYQYTRFVNDEWITVRHIVHNRLRHDRSHTGSFESDQEYLKKNWHQVKILAKELEEYGVKIPNLESE